MCVYSICVRKCASIRAGVCASIRARVCASIRARVCACIRAGVCAKIDRKIQKPELLLHFLNGLYMLHVVLAITLILGKL